MIYNTTTNEQLELICSMITNTLTKLILSTMYNTSVIYLYRYGVVDIFINENGNEFVNLIAEDLYERTGVKQWITSPYHPQANGLGKGKE